MGDSGADGEVIADSAVAVAEDCTTALKAYDEVGLRCASGPGTKDQGPLGVGPGSCDDDFLAGLPDDLAACARARCLPGDDAIAADGYIAVWTT